VKKPRIYALTYHDVARTDRGPSGITGVGRGHYELTWERFSEHLDAIAQIVRTPPAILHERTEDGGGDRAWCLTFDDGGASALEVGEELGRRGWRAYFFVTTGLIGRSGFLGEEAIRELDRMGHVVGSHSVTHPDRMSSLPTERLLAEWQESVAALSELLGREIRTGSVPGGGYSRRVALLAAGAGITTLFTSEPTTAPRRVDHCLVVGRYPVRQGTSARDAARAAAGHPAPWLVHYLGWNLRKAAKAHGGRYYDRARRRLLKARYGSPARR
jgi:peptidoglycan/xylan/chitin deacetylase (PgdA/CDA1 family)